MKSFLEAVATEEGFYVHGSRPQRLNNPGDLEYRGWEQAFNGTLILERDKRFTFFRTPEDGFRALQHLFTFPIYIGKTLNQVFNTYAPPKDGNNTNAYLETVCRLTGLTSETVLTKEILQLPF